LLAAGIAVSFSCIEGQAKPAKDSKVNALLTKSYRLYKAKDFVGAQKCLDQALEISPKSSGLFFLRAESRRQNGQLQEAVSDFQTASLYLSMDGKEKQAKYCKETAAQLEAALYAGKTPAPPPLPKAVKDLQYALDHPNAATVLTAKPGAATTTVRTAPSKGAPPVMPLSKAGIRHKEVASTGKPGSN